ncbi:MAG: hypothetical protein NXH70_02300 [Hyphomonas sp.]|nr:hypothetical protein [Hyphomonas sp.]
MTHPSLNAAASPNGGIAESILDVSAVPIMLLPRWYWGIAGVAAVSAIGADYNGVIESPMWLSTMPLYGPFLPFAVVITVFLTILLLALFAVAVAMALSACRVGLPMLGRLIWRNTFGRFRKSEA